MNEADIQATSRQVTTSQKILLSSHGLRLGLGTAITAILGQTLSPDGFGFFALIVGLFYLTWILQDLGLGSVAVKEIAQGPGRERQVLEGVLAWRRLSGLGIAVGVVLYASLEADPWRKGVLIATAVALPLLSVGGLAIVLQLRQRPHTPAFVGVCGQALVLVGVLVLKWLDAEEPLYAALIIMRETLNAGATWWAARRHLDAKLRPGFTRRSLRPFFRMAGLQALTVLAQTIYFQVDIFFVRALCGEKALGAYAASYRPMMPLLALPGILILPWMPVIAQRAAKDLLRFKSEVESVAITLTLMGLIGGLAGAFMAESLIALLYGGRYLSNPLRTVDTLRWLCLAFGFVFATSSLSSALFVMGRLRILLWISVGGLCFNLLANAWLIPQYGFEAAAWTTAWTEGLVCIAALTTWSLSTGWWQRPAEWLALPLVASAMSVVFLCLPDDPWAEVILGSVFSLTVLALLLRSPLARRHR